MRFLITSCCLILLLLTQTHTYAKILFVADDSLTGRRLNVMDDDGSNVKLLSHQAGSYFPRWSPDGKQIVFGKRSEKNSNDFNIFIMNADGTDISQLTTIRDNHPSFSPDGKSIVFNRDEVAPDGRSFKPYICLMNLENGIVKKIANVNANTPSFSSNGKHIVFSEVPTFGKSGGNIWIMGTDGRGLRELLPPLSQGVPIISRWFPAISPDGKQLLYFQDEVIPHVVDGVSHLIPQAYRYFIYDLITGQSQELNIPKDYKCARFDWMDGNRSIVFSAFQVKLNEVQTETENYNIYKYNIWTKKIITLKDDMVDSFLFPDWISDDVLSVTPHSKKKVTWGEIKQ